MGFGKWASIEPHSVVARIAQCHFGAIFKWTQSRLELNQNYHFMSLFKWLGWVEQFTIRDEASVISGERERRQEGFNGISPNRDFRCRSTKDLNLPRSQCDTFDNIRQNFIATIDCHRHTSPINSHFITSLFRSHERRCIAHCLSCPLSLFYLNYS